MTDLTPLARQLIGRVADRRNIPRYGSTTWDMLADQDPRRAAAIMIAAEAWRDHCSPERVAADLLAEMVDRDDDARRRLRETSWDVHSALYPHLWDVTTPHHLTRLPAHVGPTLTEIRNARTDYDGGPWAKRRNLVTTDQVSEQAGVA